MAWRLFCAWRYGGEDPWRLYHGLDAEYRLLRAPDRPPVRPKFPSRVKAFMYACAEVAANMEGVKRKVTDGRAGRGR